MNERKYERYYSLAGKASFENWDTVKRSGMCGCYYCGSIFPASEVGEDDWTPDWHGRTVLCPRCGIDAVLGDACGIPIREDVLEELYEEKFGSGGPDPRIVGSGTFNLDTIVVRDRPDSPAGRAFTERVALQEVGGTCGNVMCLLAGMGFEAYPQACLDDSPEGLRITDDLERYGCDTRFVTNTPDGGTTLLRVTHRTDPDGTPRISVRAGSPGGSRFPRRKYLRARDQAPAFVGRVTQEFIPDFYFFDTPAAGHRYMARAFRQLGTTVFFEPSGMSTNADLESVRQSDIIQFSAEDIPDTSFTDAFPDKLFIQTLGRDGLRYRFRGGDWKALPPVPNDNVVDTEGAGDCLTAAFIAGLSCHLNPDELAEETVADLLAEAQRFASASVSVLGTKGPRE